MVSQLFGHHPYGHTKFQITQIAENLGRWERGCERFEEVTCLLEAPETHQPNTETVVLNITDYLVQPRTNQHLALLR